MVYALILMMVCDFESLDLCFVVKLEKMVLVFVIVSFFFWKQ